MSGARSGGGPVLALVGPTATGKSAVTVEVARSRTEPVEIVAVDAFTVYRGMDVGTAKPPTELREEIPHHMVDVLDPWEELTVWWFQQAARKAVDDIRARGAVPLMVGGSGLYFRAVVDDLRFPPTDPEVRAEIEERYATDPARAHTDLEAVDPEAAAKIDPLNLRRSVRALEVVELTGEPFSAFAGGWEDYEPVYGQLDVRGLDLSSADLRQRIRSRAEAMVDAGLVDEVRHLSRLDLSGTAREAIGYREALEVLAGNLDEDDLAAEIERRTWRYAKRQRSWFRKDPRVQWQTAADVVAAWSG